MKRLATFSFDDGIQQDEPVAAWLRENGCAATFYIVADNIPKINRPVYRCHEIGSHTLSHPHLHECPDAQVMAEVCKSATVLAKWTGDPVTSFAYPYGQATLETAVTARAARYRFARTYAIDPENVMHCPEPYLWPVSAKFEADPMPALKRLVRDGKPIHVAGHSYYFFDSKAKMAELHAIVTLLKEAGYAVVTNRELFESVKR